MVSFLALSVMTNADAAGIRFDVIPSIRLQEGWRSNVYNSSNNEVSSFGTRVVPGLGLKLTAPDDVKLQLTGEYEKIWYYAPDAKNADYGTWNFKVDSSGAWKFSPNFSMKPSAFYINTIDSYRRVQLLPSDDPILPPITITNYGNTKTQQFGGAADFEYLPSPKVTLGVSGNYREKRFSSDNVAGSGLTNDTQVGGGVSFSYLVSPRSKVGVVASGSHQTFENAGSSNVYQAGIKFDYRFSPQVHLDATFGESHIRQNSGPGKPDQSKSTPSGLFRIYYISEAFLANLYGSAVYSGGSGFGETTRLYTTGLTLSGPLAIDVSWNLAGTYQVSRSVFTQNDVKINTMHGTGGLKYQPWRLAYLYLTGTMNRQESTGRYGSTINNLSTVLGFTVTNSYNIF